MLGLKKKKVHIPFNLQKVKNYLLNYDKKIKEQENIKKEKFNNTAIKKLYKMTALNIEEFKNKHPYIPPSIGSYSPNYESIYKKTKSTIILDNRKKTDENYFNNKSRINNNTKDLSLKTLNIDNKRKFMTISSRNTKKDLLSEDKDKKNDISSFNTKYNVSKNPFINDNKENSSNFNTISNVSISSNLKMNILRRKKIPKIKNFNFNKDNDDKNNNSINSGENSKNKTNKSNSSGKNILINTIDIFNKTRPKCLDPYFINNLQNKIKLKSLDKDKNRTNSWNDKKKNLSHNKMVIKPSQPSIGYYNPNYDFIKESIPKISFLYHNIEKDKDRIEYKKHLLRKIISKYDVNKEYEIIKKLNEK